MLYLDTQEIDTLCAHSPLWSNKHFAPVQFKRADFHIDTATLHGLENAKTLPEKLPSIDTSIRATLLKDAGIHHTGPIRMLVNLRYWGVNMNPICTYYCFDRDGENVVAILAEVHNTPWGERHAYVLSAGDFSKKQRIDFNKKLHVSPFNPMDMQYQWHSTTPGQQLTIHLENWQDQEKVMDATLVLKREPLNSTSMNKILIRFPWMTVKVIAAIYWQALKLVFKRVPIISHPKYSASVLKNTKIRNSQEVTKP